MEEGAEMGIAAMRPVKPLCALRHLRALRVLVRAFAVPTEPHQCPLPNGQLATFNPN